MRLAWLLLSTWMTVQAQAPLGSLLYADPTGQGIRLTIVDSGLPDRMTIRSEEGLEGRFRAMVLALAGSQCPAGTAIQALSGTPPAAWTVASRSGGSLFAAEGVAYWRFAPDQALPVRFTFEGRIWSLQSADLPLRRF